MPVAWDNAKPPTNPLGYVVVFRVPQRRDTQMIEYLVGNSIFTRKATNVKTPLSEGLHGDFEGCVAAFLCLTVWSRSNESVKQYLAQRGVQVVHIERFTRGRFDTTGSERVQEIVRDLRGADAAGASLPYDVLMPPGPTGLQPDCGVILPKPPRSGAQPNRVRRAPIDVNTNLVDSHVAPPGCVAVELLTVYKAVALSVRRLPSKQIPATVRGWREQGYGVAHSYFSKTTRAQVQQRQMMAGVPMHDIAGQLFTTNKTKLARLVEYISEYHHYLSTCTDNATLKLQRMSTTIYLTTCVAVGLGRLPLAEMRPLEVTSVYDVRVVPGAAAFTELEEETARKLTAAARLVLRHPDLTPQVAMTLTQPHALDWAQLVTRNIAAGRSQPGRLALKQQRLFGHARDPVDCKCALGAECSECYHCPFLQDGTPITVAAAVATYERWLRTGRGGQLCVPWTHEMSFLRAAVHLHVVMNPVGHNGHASQVGAAVRQWRAAAQLPDWEGEVDVLLPSQLSGGWTDTLCDRWKWAVAGTRARKRKRAGTPQGVCQTIATAQGSLRQSGDLFDADRRHIPLLMPYTHWTDASQLMHLLQTTAKHHASEPRSEVYCVGNHMLMDAEFTAHRSWRSPAPAPANAPIADKHAMAAACGEMLQCVALTRSPGGDILPAGEWAVPPTNVDTKGRPVTLPRTRPDCVQHALTLNFDYPGLQNVSTVVAVKNAVNTCTSSGDIKAQAVEAYLPHMQIKHAQALGDQVAFPHSARSFYGAHPSECTGPTFDSASLTIGPTATRVQMFRAFMHACERVRTGSADQRVLHLPKPSRQRLAAAIGRFGPLSAEQALRLMEDGGATADTAPGAGCETTDARKSDETRPRQV